MYTGLQVNCPLFLSHFSELFNFFDKVFIKYSNATFHENTSSEGRLISYERRKSHTTKVIVAFPNLANAFQKLAKEFNK